jgi:predicted nucleic acid-binding protein
VLYALFDKSDGRNSDASAIMLRILKGGFGSPIIIDYVILETVTLLNQRKINSQVQPLMQFLRENRFTIFFVTEKIFSEAIEMTIKSEADFLNVSDSSQIVVSKALGVPAIATFDSVLGKFFETCIGKGYYKLLDEKEKRTLQ